MLITQFFWRIRLQFHVVVTNVEISHSFDDENSRPDGVTIADVNQRVDDFVSDARVQLRKLSGDELVKVAVVLRDEDALEVIQNDVKVRTLPPEVVDGLKGLDKGVIAFVKLAALGIEFCDESLSVRPDFFNRSSESE